MGRSPSQPSRPELQGWAQRGGDPRERSKQVVGDAMEAPETLVLLPLWAVTSPGALTFRTTYQACWWKH